MGTVCHFLSRYRHYTCFCDNAVESLKCQCSATDIDINFPLISACSCFHTYLLHTAEFIVNSKHCNILSATATLLAAFDYSQLHTPYTQEQHS